MLHIVCNCIFIVSSDQLLQIQLEIKCYKVKGEKVESWQSSGFKPRTLDLRCQCSDHWALTTHWAATIALTISSYAAQVALNTPVIHPAVAILNIKSFFRKALAEVFAKVHYLYPRKKAISKHYQAVSFSSCAFHVCGMRKLHSFKFSYINFTE